MAAPRYIGLTMADVAAELRLHAAKIADGTHPRPRRAVLIEYAEDGTPEITTFGTPYASQREAIEALLTATLFLNADASH